MDYLLQDRAVMGGVALLAWLISYFSIPVIIGAARRRNLFDHPDYERKIHSESIPTLGGIAIFLAFLLSYSVSPWSDSLTGFSYLVAALLILFFVGLKDDLVTLSATVKLGAQISAVGLVMYGSGILITDFHGVLGLAEIPLWVALPVTLLTVIVVINAVNLIDGIDGLAGGIGTLASLLFGFGFFYVGQVPMAVFSFCLAGALLGFLWYNFSPASIFMGDTGSMILGFLLSIQAIAFMQLGAMPEFTQLFGNAVPVLTVAVLAFPLFDTIRVIVKRFRRGRSIFTAGQDHIHHEFLRMGFSHRSASITLYLMSAFLVGFSVFLSQMPIDVNLQLGAVITACIVIYPTNGFKRRLFTKCFGSKWQRLYSYKWGVEFDRERIDPLSSLTEQPESKIFDLSDKEKESEEKEKIAV
ncbi:UDP-N-acetylmuramyl pentapeptide phosphotransferase/UDP-N-acetylglucosamine-1-phosphate transferase [Fodinibius roseus]|uniref:UDP-N-acetylmuramyl pentapeptide phosphotransferase/UDP-N-acetylglucosamine-1-phosphate transferase n=1 Tax=Fodinibius roseus TaxID=1194090 RepID=A0A1M5LTT9_9BACT|nr:MraY family glycosyltransferase [Fodinibius roseus]SHG68310.1 UDP-N-acetylmuramyl pentapeptide phosphotransferase/UDP-N-acetylglucosamine-1-phosphate transferase [Fodinibius roseus]